MTTLLAALGRLPAALANGLAADPQRPFALVIVSGRFTRLWISIFLPPALYAPVARDHNRLEVGPAAGLLLRLWPASRVTRFARVAG